MDGMISVSIEVPEDKGLIDVRETLWDGQYGEKPMLNLTYYRNGRPLGKPLSFGAGKWKQVLKAIDSIKEFVTKHEGSLNNKPNGRI